MALLGLVLAVTFVAYVSTLKFEFINDDHDQILNNPVVYAWKFVPRYFTSSIWDAVYPNHPDNHYRPLFLLWLRLNDMLFGLQPLGWHLTTVLLHLLVTFLVYHLARSMLHDEVAAGIAALIFGLHPVHLEAVAWVSGVTEPLVAAPVIGSFLAFLHSRKETRWRRLWWVASLFLFAGAALAKETALVLPVMIVVYCLLFAPPAPPQRVGAVQRLASAASASLPFFLLAAIYLLARIKALGALGYALTPLPPTTVLFTLPSVVWLYVQHLLWPVGLSPYYDLPYVTEPMSRQFLLPFVALLVVGLLFWSFARKSPALLVAVAWMFFFLAPVLDITVFEPGDFVRDRFLYLPSVGFALLAGYALRQIRWGKATWQGQPVTQWVALALLAILLTVGTVTQSIWWASDLLHASRSVQQAPGSIYGLHNLATELGANGKWDQAIPLYQKVLDRRPDYWPTLYDLGVLYYRLGQPHRAEPYYEAALRARPGDPRAYLGLGLVRLQEGKLDEAESLVRNALTLQPQGRGYNTDLGLVLKAKGETAAALEAFRAELRLHPDEPLARQQIAELESQRLQETPPEPRLSPAARVPKNTRP